jgi:hypothetical protein
MCEGFETPSGNHGVANRKRDRDDPSFGSHVFLHSSKEDDESDNEEHRLLKRDGRDSHQKTDALTQPSRHSRRLFDAEKTQYRARYTPTIHGKGW